MSEGAGWQWEGVPCGTTSEVLWKALLLCRENLHQLGGLLPQQQKDSSQEGLRGQSRWDSVWHFLMSPKAKNFSFSSSVDGGLCVLAGQELCP